MAEALIIDACRTPRGIGKVGKGALADIHPQQLAASVLAAMAKRNNLNTAEVDDIIWGTSSQRGKQGGDLGRMAALDAGYDIKASGVTLDRFCGSGITSVNLAAAMIMSGMEDLVIAGGFFNTMVRLALQRRGWKLVENQGFKYWSFSHLERGLSSPPAPLSRNRAA